MKKLFKSTNIKSFLLLLGLFSSVGVLAKNISGVVTSIQGNAFFSSGGKTKSLKVGMHIPHHAEIFTGEGSQITFNDYYDHVFHLSGSGHIVLNKNLTELQEGYLWVQSLSHDPLEGPFSITTANAEITYTAGEGIFSFDSHAGKTQVLAVKKSFLLKNLLQEHLTTKVEEGKFSFIETGFNEGAPRRPTPIGFSSFERVTGLFKGVQPLNNKEKRAFHKGRSIASVSAKKDHFEMALKEGSKKAPESKVTIRKIFNEKKEKEKSKNLLNFYQAKVKALSRVKKVKKKAWKRAYSKKANVQLNIFGGSHKSGYSKKVRFPASEVKAKKQTSRRKISRSPASIKKVSPFVAPQKVSAFEGQLLDQYKKQMRHEKEVNQLIEELQSIDLDYKRDY